VSKGGSPKYKAAEAEYKRLMQEEEGGEWNGGQGGTGLGSASRPQPNKSLN
jgi:hypothetical protein